LKVPYWKVVEALYWMCFQYLRETDGTIYSCISAGEETIEVLEDIGLLKDDKLIDMDEEKFKSMFGEN